MKSSPSSSFSIFAEVSLSLQKTAQSHPLKTAIPVHFSIIRFYLVAKILFFPS